MSGGAAALQRVLVFGATSSIAQEVLRVLVGRGASVCCVGRNEQKLAALLSDLRVRSVAGRVVEGMVADLEQTEKHATLFDAARDTLGDLDAILVAHGVLPDQTACETSAAAALEAIAINGTSVISLVTLAARLFEAKGAGVIAVIGSVAGDRGRKSNYVYGAAKGLVGVFMQGVRHRLAGTGVRVVTIKPGLVDTPMTAGFVKDSKLWSDPAVVARGIVRAMERSNGDVYLPWFWYWIMLVIRHIPERLFLRLNL